MPARAGCFCHEANLESSKLFRHTGLVLGSVSGILNPKSREALFRLKEE